MIAVVGSINQDLVFELEEFPAPGETARASRLSLGHGGKGANQAVGVARLGRDVAFIGRVGAGEPGGELLRSLAAEGVDVDGVAVDSDAPSGTAVVMVDKSGENAIVAGAGANERVSIGDVEAQRDVIRRAKVVLLQLEIPIEAVAAAARIAAGLVVLDPAPAMPLPEELLVNVDVLVPNRGELETLTGDPNPASAVDISSAATVVTLGAEGAAIVDSGAVELIPAPRVRVVDTTGAGDAFCAALADALAEGAGLREATVRAVAAGALAATALGARSALPTRVELDAFLRATRSG